MTASPLFSVVVPAFNRADVLASALSSVFAQTCQDFEIVVVDDGSSDDPQRIVDGIADSRLRFVRQENAGPGAARNLGIDLARGHYIAMLDSDDRFLPHHLQTMACLLSGTNGTAAFAPIIVDRGAGRSFVKPPRAPRPGENMATYLLCDRGFVPTITLVLPREIAARVRYDPSVRYGDDKDFAIRLSLAGCRFVMAAEPGAVWRDQPDPARLSAGRKGAELLPWIENLRPRLPARAYYGCRGWPVAKGVVMTSRLGALKLFAEAVLHGAYSPAMAARVFLQIFLPDGLYRRLADGTLRPAPEPQHSC